LRQNATVYYITVLSTVVFITECEVERTIGIGSLLSKLSRKDCVCDFCYSLCIWRIHFGCFLL